MTEMNDIYQTLMKIGSLTGCHQLPERSIFIKGHQLPLCARCTGIVIGEIAAIPLWFLYPIGFIPTIALGLPLAVDGILQYRNLLPSTNPRRLFTGILAGWGLMTIYIHIFLLLIKLLSITSDT